jgi:adenylate cyclase
MSKLPVTIIALFLVFMHIPGLLFAENRFDGGSQPLVLDGFLMLESPRAEGAYLDLSDRTPGVETYRQGHLPNRLTDVDKMYTFAAVFRLDKSLEGEDLSLYLGLFEYPFRVYLNGTRIAMRGRYRDGHYNSSLRTVTATYLPPEMLKYGTEENRLVLEIYPRTETWGLDRIKIGRSADIARDVFLRNFVGINLVQAAVVLSLLLAFYFLGLFLAEKRRQEKNLFFTLICLTFCLSYFGIAVHYESFNELLMEALSKGGLILLSSAMVVFCSVFTGVLSKRKILPFAMLAVGLAGAVFVVIQPDKDSMARVFGYLMNFLIVPQLLLDIVILVYALVKLRNRYSLLLLGAFVFIITAAAHDVIAINRAVLPYAWMTAFGYFAVVAAIFTMLTMEQSNLYHQSLQQTADLIINQARIEALNQELTRQKDSFFRFVPTQFLQLLGRDSAVDIRLGDSTLRFLSILFSDIRQFSNLSEKMLPGENFEFLNNYLFRMEKAIQRNRGFVDKYIGDAVMALFAGGEEGNPGGKSLTADKSLAAALEMRRELQDFNQFLKEKGLSSIDIGIGINTGEVMLGTVGSETRLDTTVIGDSVNVSSRLENLTKFYRTGTLVSEQSVISLVKPEDYHFRMVDHVTVPGRDKPLMVYELLDPENPHDQFKGEYSEQFDTSMTLYLSRMFHEAYMLFKQLQERNNDDFLPRLFAERCATYLKNPPPTDWDGVFRIRKKESDQ